MRREASGEVAPSQTGSEGFRVISISATNQNFPIPSSKPSNRVEKGLGPSLPLHRTYGSVYGATSWYGFRHYCLLLRRLLAKFNRFTCPPFQPLRVTIPSPWLSLRVRATVGLLTVTCNTTTLGPSGTASPTMASADSRSLAFLSHSALPR